MPSSTSRRAGRRPRRSPRLGVVGSPEYSRALHPPCAWSTRLLVVPGYRGKKMRIAARRTPAVVHDVEVQSETVTLTLRSAPGPRSPRAGATCAGRR